MAEVAAGEPLEYLPEDEVILFPEVGAPSEQHNEILVRARGDSMVEFGIHDGDYLVVEMRQGGVAALGEILIARFRGGLTVKRWERGEKTRRRLGGTPSFDIEEDDDFELIAIVRDIWTHTRLERKS